VEMKENKYHTVIDLPIMKKGEVLTREGAYYTNEDESVVLRSTNYTGKIIKKTKDESGSKH
jgi:hypothetical protein